MFIRLATFVVSVVSGLSFGAGEGIPYALECSGEESKAGTRLVLKLEEVESVKKLSKVLLDKKDQPVGEKEYFTVDNIGPIGKKFLVESTWEGLFAGGGSRKGNLSFKTKSKKGTWVEVTTTFDETTQKLVRDRKSRPITCELAE